MPRRMTIFQGYVPGTLQSTGFQCIITVLEEDPLNWRVAFYHPYDSYTGAVFFKFRVQVGEELSSATTRLTLAIRQSRQNVAWMELQQKLDDYENSIEENPQYVIH